MKGIDNHIVQLFKKYFAGNANRLEMRQLEQEAEGNPYLHDAKEGVDKLSLVAKETAIRDLQAKLAKRTGTKQNKIAPMQWLKLAAGIAILLSAGFYIWRPATADNMAESSALDKQTAPQTEIKKPTKSVQAKEFPSTTLQANENPFDVAGEQNSDSNIVIEEETELITPNSNQSRIAEKGNTQNAPKPVLPEEESYTEATTLPEKESSFQIDGVGVEGNLIPESDSGMGRDITEVKKTKEAAKSRFDNIDDIPVASASARAKMPKKEADTILSSKPNEVSDITASDFALGEENDILQNSIPGNSTEENVVFKTYLKENLVMPEAAKQNYIKGKVVLLFDVDAAGRPTNIEVKKSLGFGCDEEAIRLLQEGPDWEPGDQDGKTKLVVKFK